MHPYRSVFGRFAQKLVPWALYLGQGWRSFLCFGLKVSLGHMGFKAPTHSCVNQPVRHFVSSTISGSGTSGCAEWGGSVVDRIKGFSGPGRCPSGCRLLGRGLLCACVLGRLEHNKLSRKGTSSATQHSGGRWSCCALSVGCANDLDSGIWHPSFDRPVCCLCCAPRPAAPSCLVSLKGRFGTFYLSFFG